MSVLRELGAEKHLVARGAACVLVKCAAWGGSNVPDWRVDRAVLGEFLPTPDLPVPPATTIDAYYTPWFPRGGNAMTVTVDVIAIVGGASIDVEVQTKNSEQADDGATGAGSLGPTPATGTHVFKAGTILSSATPGLLELVRYKVTITGGDPGAGVFVRFQNPSWLDN